MRFPTNIHKELKNYVYAYYDPTDSNNLPFYIGRGVGSPCHYSYNEKGEIYKFDKNMIIINP